VAEAIDLLEELVRNFVQVSVLLERPGGEASWVADTWLDAEYKDQSFYGRGGMAKEEELTGLFVFFLGHLKVFVACRAV
jgi:hypothetical protein